MARPRKPTQLHVISGSDKKHPDRMRERENEPVTSGDLAEMAVPVHLDENLAKLWVEIAGSLHSRVSGVQDAIAFEAMVRLVAVMRAGAATAADYARLKAFLGEFGMTPASRSKVAAGKLEDKPKGFAALKGVG